MPKQQEGVTDRLVSTIQIIQQARGSGVLTVRRGKGTNMEEGIIAFAKGQVTDARFGGYTGTKAFNLLSTWENCAFLYALTDEQDPLLPFSQPLSSASNGHIPAVGGKTPPFVAISPLRKAAATPRPSGEHVIGSGTEQSPSILYLTAIPHLLGTLEMALSAIEKAHLSRTHRQISLLADGQHTVADIMRVTGRTQSEVYALLRDLERASVLWIQDEPARR